MLSITALCETEMFGTGLCLDRRDSGLSAGCRLCVVRSSQGCTALNCVSARQAKSHEWHIQICLPPFCGELACKGTFFYPASFVVEINL